MKRILIILVIWGSLSALLCAQNIPPADSFNPGVNGNPFALAVQTDGKVLVGGSFTVLGGQARTNFGRVNADGTIDSAFVANASGFVAVAAIQTNGSILMGGQFTNVAGQSRNYIARLNSDGSLDGSFNPGASAQVKCLAIQADGKIVLGGDFTTLAGQTRNKLARLNADGSLDGTFDPEANNSVISLALQPDGKIVVSGYFSAIAGGSRTNTARLNADGTLDTSFDAGTNSPGEALLIQPDGKIVIGSDYFILTAGQNNPRRLNANGSLDTAFNPGITQPNYPGVYSLALQTDGKILVGGIFDTLGGAPRSGLGRVDANGVVDASFYPGTGLVWVYGLAVQSDGKTLASGVISALGGQPCTNIARLTATDPVPESITFNSSTITWLRGGDGPEVWRASFEVSTNGVLWSSVGEATRIAGGWQLTGLALPTGPLVVRARGFVYSGTWFEEFIGGQPILVSQPTSRTNNALTTATFAVSAVGGGPLAYQWLHNGTNLANGVNVQGAQSASLSISNVLGGDAGQYQAVITNNFGSITSSVATLVVIDPLLTSQPSSVNLNVGGTTTLSASAIGTLPLSYVWLKNGAPVSGATGTSLVLSNVQGGDAAKYTLVASNQFGSVTSSVAFVTVNLSTPDGFSGFVPSGTTLMALALQPDGKVIVGYGAATHAVLSPVRFFADGSIDTAFTQALGSSIVGSMIVQTDGNIVMAGSAAEKQRIFGVWRVHNDGTIDSGFTNNLGTGISGTVLSTALQADGKILVGGSFSSINGQSHTNLGRFNGDGTLDTNFTTGANSQVYSIALQPDGKALIGGSFTTVNGQTHTRLARVNSDSTLDTNFNAAANNTVECMAVQADGKILVGGQFSTLNGVTVNCIGRLNTDGTLDASFNPNANSTVYSLAIQTDGRILVGGAFAKLGTPNRSFICRLNVDGTPDLTLNPGANGTVAALALQDDGKFLVGGSFNQLNGLARTNLARLNNTDPVAQSLTSDGSTITWLRSGTGPEVWRTTFEQSTDGVTWTTLGAGQRVSGGWQLGGLNLGSYRNLRARGFATGSQGNASSWPVELVVGAPVLASQPANRTNNAGSTVSIFAAAEGTPPLNYQWLKNGAPLSNGLNVSGVTNATLTLSNVLGGDGGAYSVIVTSGSGSITGLVNTLTVIDPVITTQPTNQLADVGQPAAFNVVAIGTAQLNYQWLKNGTNFGAANSPTLTLSNVQAQGTASYSVVVSSAYGSATSSVVTLTVNLAAPDSFNPGPNNQIRALAVQADGKILVGGNFGTLNGQPRSQIGRLNPDGSLDTSFNPGANSSVDCFALQPDGKILAGGWFTVIAGQSQGYLARLNTNGALDSTFTPSISGPPSPSISSVVIQPDGKIIFGGYFSTWAGQSKPYLGRLNANGSADTSLSSLINNYVIPVALQLDGKILIGGWFTSVSGHAISYIARLGSDGILDVPFNPAVNSYVYAIVVQPDGKILLGGNFTTINGVFRDFIARLNSDGTLDLTFNPSANGAVNSLALQADGKIIVGGGFSSIAGQARSYIARLNANGSIDPTFFPSVNSPVISVGLQGDGKVLVGGGFTSVDGQPRSCVARLTASTPGLQYLSSDGQSVTWLNVGCGPEVFRTTFESSMDGINWSALGAGVRISNGWQIGGVALSINAMVRARGYTSGGYWQGSGWFIESVAPVLASPMILGDAANPNVVSNQFNFTSHATPGQVVVIQATSDFITWTPIQTNSATANGTVSFTDPQTGLFPRRYYRTVLYRAGGP